MNVTKWIMDLISGAVTLAIPLIPAVLTIINNNNKSKKQIVDCVELLYYDKLEELYEQYTEEGYCPKQAKRVATRFYNACKKQGWNGEMAYLYESLSRLPDSKGDK